MKKAKGKKFIWIFLFVLLNIGVILGISWGRYTGAWKHGFGLIISPAGGENILKVNDGDGKLFDKDTKHIIFGKTEDYAAVVSTLSETKKHVGSDTDDGIWSYYDKATGTTYVLSDSTIYLNPNSSGLFKELISLETVTFGNYSTEKATDMGEMFNGCSALTTVYADENFNAEKATNSEDMFTGCYVLVGGKGTKVYPGGGTETTQPLDKTYALVDGLNDQPGYFTDESAQVRYFRSNELFASAPVYTVNGTTAWFTVANALNSFTYSNSSVAYTLTWSVSTDGVNWTEYKTESGIFSPNSYQKHKYVVAPVTQNGTTYNWIKVQGTTSFLQEDIEAVYQFVYDEFDAEWAYSSGVITLTLNTNNFCGDFEFSWIAGITPDNSDPTGLFKDAAVGPSELTVELEKNTEYEFLFFVTDGDLLQQLENGTLSAESAVTVSKK